MLASVDDWFCEACGRTLERSCVTPRSDMGCRIDAEMVIARLREAGECLMALPAMGYSTRLVQSSGLEWVQDATEASETIRRQMKPPAPHPAVISRMDEALRWVSLIPHDKRVLRRVVGARCLIHPMTGRQLYSWRRVAVLIGADHKAVQRWHEQGIDRIVAALRKG